ncbi:MAG: hypothetical protein JRG83_10535 [Deltaproteobacteria bacterium]|nr:hypothetical protein [Deltaproteobacteria bacterium]
MASSLAGTRTLWFLFAATLALSCSFPLVASYWQLTLLDGITSPADARSLLDSFTPHQKMIHAWITATLDVAYPLAYGGLFAGSALRVFTRHGRYLAVPAFLVIPTDLIEGVVQILALTGTADWLGLKSIVTPAKFLLFGLAFCIAAIAWATWLYRRTSGRS